MGYEKDSVSWDLEHAQVSVQVDKREPRILGFLERLSEWTQEISFTAYAWYFLYVVRKASWSYPDCRTALVLTEGQIEEGKRLFADGWYYVKLTPACRFWIPRTVIWAVVATVTFGWYKNNFYLRLAQLFCVTIAMGVSALNMTFEP